MPNRHKFSAVAAPIERPLPLWILYPLFFVAIYLSHWPLLRLPFFWDEAGYYIPAALDFFHGGTLIPHSTLSSGHPPLPSILLAGWWSLSGVAIHGVIGGTRTFVAMIAAAALLGVFRLVRLLAGSATASIVTFLTALYPVWFAQSTLAHADIFAAAFTLWALSFYFERYVAAATARMTICVAALFSLAALSKETAIVTPVALGLWEIVLLLTESRNEKSVARWEWLVALAVPAIPLIAWYAYHFHKTGFIFGNPEFLRYNATANLTPLRVLVSLWHRVLHLSMHMNMYVPLVASVAAYFMPRLSPVRTELKAALTAIGILIAGNAIAFSFLGGALLTRYLLPLYPFVLLLCVLVWQSRGPRILGGLTALTAGGFVAGLFINPPYSIAPEDNLTYRDFVVLHQQAIAVIVRQYPGATVLSAWPATVEMQFPVLGYAPRPIKTVAIDNFSLDQIQHAAADPGAYDTALIFSTKWIPPPGRFSLTRATESTDARFFDFHRDLSPREAAALLHGDVVWQRYRNGEWAAVLRFPRSQEAGFSKAREP